MKSDLLEFDYSYRKYGRWIAGMDEAGRGPGAGPVVAACIITESRFPEITDSKKLKEQQIQRLATLLREHPKTWIGIGAATAQEIDEINVLEATKLAMTRAYQDLEEQPDVVLVDHVTLSLDVPTFGITKGDSLSYAIAAASIIAKATRDTQMRKYDADYPEYGFAAHKGYLTKKHLAALAEHGICPIHRRTYKPIRKILENA